MKDRLTLTLPSELFADLVFFSLNEQEIDEETMNELKQKLDQLLAGQAELKAQHHQAEPQDSTQAINRLFTLVKRDYNNRLAIEAVQLPASSRNFPPYQGEVWRAKTTLTRPSDLPIEQTGSGFHLEISIPERLQGKRGMLRHLDDKPEIDLNQWWSGSDFKDYGIGSSVNLWINGFAPNETHKTAYIIFQAYPEISDLTELEWEEASVSAG